MRSEYNPITDEDTSTYFAARHAEQPASIFSIPHNINIIIITYSPHFHDPYLRDNPSLASHRALELLLFMTSPLFIQQVAGILTTPRAIRHVPAVSVTTTVIVRGH